LLATAGSPLASLHRLSRTLCCGSGAEGVLTRAFHSGRAFQQAQPWLSVVKSLLQAKAAFVAASFAVLTGAAAGLVYVYSENGVASNMCKVFAAGGVRDWSSDWTGDSGANHVSRAQLEVDVSELLTPSRPSETQYVVIVGAAGTGKSTSVRRAVRALPAPKGAIYFLAPSAVSCFSTELAQAVGHYRTARWADACLRLATGETKEEAPPPAAAAEPRATWNALRLSILRAAKQYRDAHGVPPTLVLDGMDLVARRDVDFFLELQDFAKLCADKGVLRVVFVFSDGRALPLLQASSAFTRARAVYEVCDIDDAEAVAWLQAEYQLDGAKDIVASIAGGRFPLLRQCADSRGTLEEMRKVLDTKTAADLIRLGVSPTAPLFRALVTNGGRVTESAAAALLDDAKLQELLRLNILSTHADRTYSFNNRHVALFVQRAVEGERWWWRRG